MKLPNLYGAMSRGHGQDDRDERESRQCLFDKKKGPSCHRWSPWATVPLVGTAECDRESHSERQSVRGPVGRYSPVWLGRLRFRLRPPVSLIRSGLAGLSGPLGRLRDFCGWGSGATCGGGAESLAAVRLGAARACTPKGLSKNSQHEI